MKTCMMLDLETLDTRPTAIVLSFGAVVFRDAGGAAEVIEHLKLRLQMTEQAAEGKRTFSEDTLRFWLNQDAAVRADAFGLGILERVHPIIAMKRVSRLFYKHNCEEIWSKGPHFDGVIWEDLCRSFHMQCPWNPRQHRDVRTLCEEAGLPHNWKPAQVVFQGVPHDPVYDCLEQIHAICEARQLMRQRIIAEDLRLRGELQMLGRRVVPRFDTPTGGDPSAGQPSVVSEDGFRDGPGQD